ncbi:hypothetical protein GUITHDRAFT_165022 [Guillardia theta CCMP2712]|uniref:Uncharacterized protein n=1 Tax=Guillardia theta (strain CCMP2712) TaxID=905079 RepID=L1IST8_GUITC|nr:hypothetical protein GUITHDRAFT_165022 [Guillardia theta CCMP2712]EKX39283.1 hypothetical protein GUITHDRAFT_165022 [Guillardia theta CCMP2712]|eukprot:XP_005826263.1 hypothetical protein GUITHDRAFT_165022 [Guillardia theta CCMP2712]
MFLPFFSADLHLPSLDFVDTCDGNNCFSVIDSYSSSNTNGFTVYDTTSPTYTGSDAVHETTSLNQTYGWGCESGDAYGSGTSFDSGVGTNQSDADIYPYNAVADKTSMLSSSYTDSAGNVYTGNNGFTVTDSYTCGSGDCGGFSISDVYGNTASSSAVQQLHEVTNNNTSMLSSSYTDSAGNVYTGNNGFTVTDSYTCGSGDCGGFSVGDVYGNTASSSAVQQLHEVTNNNTSMLSCSEFTHCESTDAAGNVYDGSNGFTVTDSYSCGSGDCGGFSVSDVYGNTASSSAVQQLHEVNAPQTQLAAPIAVSGVEVPKPQAKPVRPSPGHLLFCGHALAFGAVSATMQLINGEKKDWRATFESESSKAANAITPVGGYVLQTHVFGKEVSA